MKIYIYIYIKEKDWTWIMKEYDEKAEGNKIKRKKQ